MPVVCPSCGAEVSATAQFCGACGVRLTARCRPAEGGARRQVAVLFCDIVGSTALSQQLDAEDLGELLLGFQQMATAAITGLGGTIAGYAGDGLVAWFGWPTAHEDDTALAVQAGLDILAGLERGQRIDHRPGGVRLSARAGVHVGPVVLRTDRADTPAFGETMNIAARLQSAAAPEHARGQRDRAAADPRAAFETTGIGAPKLKGVDREIQVHRVDGPRDDGRSRARVPSMRRSSAATDELARLTAPVEAATRGRDAPPSSAASRASANPGCWPRCGPRWRARPTAGLSSAARRSVSTRRFAPIAEMVRRALDIGHTDAPERAAAPDRRAARAATVTADRAPARA